MNEIHESHTEKETHNIKPAHPSSKKYIVIAAVLFVILIGLSLTYFFTSQIKENSTNPVSIIPGTPTPTIPYKEEYQNPFDKKTEYQNPFE